MMEPHIRLELARARAAALAGSARRHPSARVARGDRGAIVRLALAALVERLLGRRAPAPANPAAVDVRIRYALAEDGAALRRLAALEGRTPPQPPLLVAEVGGEVHAALSLWDGQAIADPFRRTQALVELLGVRAAQLQAAGADLLEPGRDRRWRSLPLLGGHGR
jgi:hypothetical protein